MVVTGHGVTVGVVRHMRDRHAHVRDSSGAHNDATTWAVTAILASVLTGRR